MPAPTEERLQEIRELIGAAIVNQVYEPLIALAPDMHQDMVELAFHDPTRTTIFLDEIKNQARLAGWEARYISQISFRGYLEGARRLDRLQRDRQRDAREASNVVRINARGGVGRARNRAPLEAGIPSANDAVARLNEQYLFTVSGERDVVVRTGGDEIAEKLKVSTFINSYSNVHVSLGDKTAPLGRVWMEHPDRRTARGGLIFDPVRASGLLEGHDSDHTVFNTWQGLGVAPVAGDWAMMAEHIRAHICQGIEADYDYLIKWLARAVQKPGERGETAIVMRGEEGAGKGVLGNALLKFFRPHGRHLTQKNQIVGRFNEQLRDTCYVFADEAFFAGDRSSFGVLKALITESTITVEAKYGTPYETPNRISLVMSSNEDHVVQASLKSRRYAVYDVPETRRGDRAYWQEFHDRLDNGGYAAMLHDLLAMDLSTYDHRDVPATAGLAAQREHSLPPEFQWWHDVLTRGVIYQSQFGHESDLEGWPDKVSTALLFASYAQWADQHRLGRHERKNLVHFGRFINSQLRFAQGRFREIIVRENPTHSGGIRREHAPGYHLPGLGEARISFDAILGISSVWGDQGEQGNFSEPQNGDRIAELSTQVAEDDDIPF